MLSRNAILEEFGPMKFASFIFTVLAFLPAFAQQDGGLSMPARVCPNASRGLILMLPEIKAGALSSPLKINHLISNLIEVSPAQAGLVNVMPDGQFSFSAKDAAGAPLLRVETAKNSVGRLVVMVHTKDQGLIGFTCP
jgi:hypothetical protein